MEAAPQRDRRQKRRHLQVLAACVAVVAGMGGLAYASVPLYELFCQVTGYGGTTRRVENVTVPVLDKRVTVRFDANVRSGLNWKFYPAQRQVTARFGETVQVLYYAENFGDTTSTGTATFNVTPQQAGAYFNKLQCFCFTDTVVKPGEKLEMPVVFFVDPELVETEEGKDVTTITLSYTFFGKDGEKPLASKAKTTTGAAGG
jgi:cytochrome c oxidase assembly protein subunit 11